ncbi:asparagine synthase (glutamine-hydrolyzing) [Micromonospora sp. WMMD1082]|uniref:asparagine synthase (glutamine-hydrolyzing) n=1 Tax=Micromonospora sp. WMMD1082 TaxID=3016104 RepID=UPI0024164321|nr:asparagine synthase (glutamine-hydrolyzing) [Micromonospora sp. WMMD1082]MDG4792761.1 asparagine synthase (glutamine-hydrolyzing) [Micromonospora sp. WMMD1082]
MCGITGWLDFGRDLTCAAKAVQAMTDTMACRGPDAEGVWLDRHVALGHRRLAVIDIEGGRQPMAAEAGGRSTVLTYSGEIYNYQELRAELRGLGHRFRTRSDTEVVLRAYLAWGDGLVDHLNGMYAFAIWDGHRQELLLVRDRLGIKPLYYYPLPDGVLFGSEPKAILANPLVEPVVDLDGLRESMAQVKTPEVTIFRGMYEVRPGHLVRVHRGGMSRRRYWALEAREHTDDLAKTISTVRDLLGDIVTRQLVADVPICAQLSGGLDSSALTALAARSLREQGLGSIRSFTVDYPGYTENLRPNVTVSTPDQPYARQLARHVGTEHHEIVLDTPALADPAIRAATIRATDTPSGSGDFNGSLYLLFRAIKEHSTVALSGESADEVFGGYPWMFSPPALAADTFAWLAFLRPGDPLCALLDPGLTARLDLDGYRAQRFRDAVAEAPRLTGEDEDEARLRVGNYLNLTRFLQGMLDRKDRMSMAAGLEVRVPFCDHRLVEYLFNVPWAMKTYDGQEKSLLRAAVRDLLPVEIAERRKATYPTTQDPAYEAALRAQLEQMLADPDAPVRPLLDLTKARRLLAEPLPEVSVWINRAGIEMALQLNVWLGRYGVRLVE